MNETKWEKVIDFACSLPMAGAVFVGLWDVTQWLKFGVWKPTTGRFITDFYGPDTWIAAPTSWLGVHSIVKGIVDQPLSLTLFGIFIILVLLKGWAENAQFESANRSVDNQP